MRGLAQSITRILREPGREWIAVEPNPPLVDRIRQWVGETPDSGLSAVTGTIADFPVNESFDSILYIDVLEHIEDDRGGGRLSQGWRPVAASSFLHLHTFGFLRRSTSPSVTSAATTAT